MTKEARNLLQQIADLCEQASEEIHVETQEEDDILTTCDKLMEQIDEYLNK